MRSCSWVVLLSLAVAAHTQQPPVDVRAGQRPAAPAAPSPTEAEAIVECLVAAEPAARHAALATVLAHPAAFLPCSRRLCELLPRDPDGTVARALDAVPPPGAQSLDDVLALLDSRDGADVEHALRALSSHGEALLPRLPALAARLAALGERAQPVFAAAAAHDHDAVVAAIEAALAEAGEDRQPMLLAALETVGIEAERRQRHLVRMLGGRNAHAVVERCAALAKDDAQLRVVLARMGATAPAPAAAGALDVLARLGPLAAENWDDIEPCLQSAQLVARAAQLALAVRARRPEAMMAMVAAVPSAPPNSLASLVTALSRCPEVARESVPVLAARLPQAFPPHSAALLETLLVLGGDAEIRRALPGLFAHTEPAVRAQACVFAVAVAIAAPEPDVAVRQAIDAAATDADAGVRQAAVLAQRLFAGRVDDGELADHLRDRDPHRVLAAWRTVRARRPTFTELEAVGAAALLANHRFAPFVERELLNDLDARALPQDRCVELLRAHRFRDAGFRARWQRTAAGAAVLAKLEAAPPGGAANERLADLAARNPVLAEQLRRAGALPAGTAVPTPAEAAARDVEHLEQLVRQLDDADPAVRSAACIELSGAWSSPWRAALANVRREGTAAQRRCAAAVLQPPPTLQAARTAAVAPEAFVVRRALEALLAARAHRPGAALAIREALRSIGARDDVWRELVRYGAADGVLRVVAAAGADAVPHVRAALAVPGLRSQVLHVLPLLGTHARPFLPEVLRALRTADASAAGGALLAMAWTPAAGEWPAVREAVEAAWTTAALADKRSLLPALVALGDDVRFATDLEEVLRSIGSAFGMPGVTTDALRGWVRVALDADAAAQRRVAMLVLTSSAIGRRLQLLQRDGGPADELWRDAAALPSLQDAMHRAVAAASPQQLRELYALVLDAAAQQQPLPATGVLLAARPELVQQLLRDGFAARATPALVAELGATVPGVLARAVVDLPVPASALLGVPVPAANDLHAAVAAALDRANGVHRAFLARWLVAMGEPAIAAVLARLDAEGPEGATASALLDAGASADWVLPALRDKVRGDHEHMASLAAQLGGKGLSLVVEVVGERDAMPFVERSLRARDPATRIAALRRLVAIDAERGLAAARDALHDGDPAVRRWAGLMLLPIDDAAVLPATLASLLLDGEPLLRRRALAALARCTAWPDDIGVLATDLLADADPAVRAAAVAAFAAQPAEAKRSRVALTEARANETVAPVRDALDAVLAR
jgi:hypothetical protein